MTTMDQTKTTNEVVFELYSFRLYKDGNIDRLAREETIPPSPDSVHGVRSKDIVISPESGLSARLFLPQIPDPTGKLPIFIYCHGGAFCAHTPFSPRYSNHVASLAAEANVIALSVHYRRPPEHPLPTAFEDGWESIQWAAAHYGGNGPEPWVNEYADLQRVFVGGDSAGATIIHGPRIVGMVLFHPYFSNDKPEKLMEIIFPSSSGPNDPRLSTGYDPNLAKLGCGRVLVLVAEKDVVRDRGWGYYEKLKKSDGWIGVVEIEETEGEEHVFFLSNPESEKAHALVKRVASFLNLA